MRLTVLTAALLLAVGNGCSGEDDTTATQQPSTTSPTASSEALLKQAVRTALEDNRRLSIYVLGNNRIPRWATRSTRGPALVSLRTAARERARRGITVRVIKSQRRVTTIRIDPSYLRATALVQDRQRVQTRGQDGVPTDRVATLNERARYDLQRVGRSDRFVVQRVSLLG